MSGAPFRDLAADLDRLRGRLAEAASAARATRSVPSLFDVGNDVAELAALVGRLGVVADDLDRAAARPADACTSPHGCCPEHGATLETIRPHGGRFHTKCRRPTCPRAWPYDRLGESCDQRATHRALAPDPDPGTGERGEAAVCAGHADQLIEWGWHVRRRPGTPGASAEADAELAERCERAARRLSVVTAAREQLDALGYDVRDAGDGMPSYRGMFPSIILRLSGPMSADVIFTHDHTTDVYTWSSAHSHYGDGSPRFASWDALVAALEAAPGARPRTDAVDGAVARVDGD